MRRLHLGLLTLALPILAASLLVMGCGGGTTKSEGGGGGGGDEGKSKSAGPAKGLKAGKGIVKGKITLKGDPPDVKKRTNDLRAEIDKKKDDKDHCLAGKDFEKEEFTYRIGDNKGVGNVFVWLKPAERGEFFEVSEDQVKELKDHPVVIDQPHCAFIPHCVVFVPRYRDAKGKEQKTGQKLIVKNSAEMSHNTNVGSENEILKPGKETEFNVKLGNEAWEMKCNIHPWMRGYIRSFDHPYATVSLAEPKAKPSDASFGTYEIKNAPVGKVRILAWHEDKGFLTKPEGEEITIKEDGPTTKDFEMEAK